MKCGTEMFTPPELHWIVSDQLMFGFANKTAYFFPENDALLQQGSGNTGVMTSVCLLSYDVFHKTRENEKQWAKSMTASESKK